MTSVFSPPGTFIPGKNITLGVGTIRGVESRGMLCSAPSCRLSDDHDGIIELPADAPVGARLCRMGRARRSGDRDQPDAQPAGLHRRVRHRARPRRRRHGHAEGRRRSSRSRASSPARSQVTLDFGATPSLCRGFALRLVRGVKNGPSPEWLQRRLTAIGLRPINALVDITNFITFDRGRPLHVFDAAKVRGDLMVRRARPAKTCWRSTARPMRSTTTCASSPTTTASNRSPASWAAKLPAARRRPPTC